MVLREGMPDGWDSGGGHRQAHHPEPDEHEHEHEHRVPGGLSAHSDELAHLNTCLCVALVMLTLEAKRKDGFKRALRVLWTTPLLPTSGSAARERHAKLRPWRRLRSPLRQGLPLRHGLPLTR